MNRKFITFSATRRAVFFTIFVFFLMYSSILNIPIIRADPGWLSGWDHRKAITITGSIAGAQTDYQIRIQVEYGSGVDSGLVVYIDGECESDFGDINFTSTDEITSLDYWIQQKVDDDVAYIWVEVDSIPESPDTKIIYIYYGKEGETTSSNFKDTWVEVDDYSFDPVITKTNGGPLGHYSLCTWGIEERTLENYRFDIDIYIYEHLFNKYGGNPRTGLYWTTLAAEMAKMDGIMLQDDTDHSEGNFYQYYYNGGSPVTEDLNLAWVEDTWYVLSYKFDANYDIDIWRKSTETYVIQDNAVNYDVLNIMYLGVGWYAAAGNPGTVTYDSVNDWINARPRRGTGQAQVYWYYDNFRVGKYCDPEPTITAWGEKEEPIIIEIPSNLFGAGFNASSPYVSLHWKSNYTDITLFEVQNSTDRITWEYLGHNTTTEYHDFQVINGTERYYKIRACNFTGVSWDNSTWSDINFEKVYFVIPEGDGVCESYVFNASSITVIRGTLDCGNLDSTYFVDDDWYNVSEVVGIAGLDVRFNFTNIYENITCGCIDIYHIYSGHSQHEVEIQVWNFTSSTWYKIGNILYNETVNWICIGLGHMPEHYVYNGNMWFRFYHPLSGHISHTLHIERIYLNVVYAEECEGTEFVNMIPSIIMGIFLILVASWLIYGVRRKR